MRVMRLDSEYFQLTVRKNSRSQHSAVKTTPGRHSAPAPSSAIPSIGFFPPSRAGSHVSWPHEPVTCLVCDLISLKKTGGYVRPRGRARTMAMAVGLGEKPAFLERRAYDAAESPRHKTHHESRSMLLVAALAAVSSCCTGARSPERSRHDLPTAQFPTLLLQSWSVPTSRNVRQHQTARHILLPAPWRTISSCSAQAFSN
ncbi:hypothetical protein EXIGLDRAFT_385289 [Exidia glandulosa HHB12029]|uniref:Uncharacterized protein n=1 Tax=Exidia glandulosa HHB12029 TaxID=1314781 RepID=A0A165BWB7_EXIGL|nr:hypothetical protein EXIGLDRAFT_385289 [Exidia glandulosa HHB12029]